MRWPASLPGLNLVEADLESWSPADAAYDLIHCALVLEYVDPCRVLSQAARGLTPDGVVVIVLQLETCDVPAVTETRYESLRRLQPLMRLHSPDEIRAHARRAALLEVAAIRERLPTGKEFYVGRFRTMR